MHRLTRILFALIAVATLTVGLGVAPTSADGANPLRQAFCAEFRVAEFVPGGPAVDGAIRFDGFNIGFWGESADSTSINSTGLSEITGFSVARYAFLRKGPRVTVIRLGDWAFGRLAIDDVNVVVFRAKINPDLSACDPPWSCAGGYDIVAACDVD
jgi:hypothetical protein